MRFWLAILGSATLTLSSPRGVSARPPDGARTARAEAGARRALGPGAARYVSSQAYHHALRAELATAADRPELAIEELKLARVYDQDSLYLLLRLGSLWLDTGKPERAARLVTEAKKAAPSDPGTLLLEARVALAQGALAVAEQALKRSVERDPGGTEAVRLYAELLVRQRRGPEALKLLRRAAERSPQSVEPLLGLARIEEARQGWAAAALALERAAQRDERRSDVVAELAGVYHRLDRDAEAAARLGAILEIVPGDPEALFAAARAELWVGNDELAESYLALLERQGDARAEPRRAALLYASEGRFARALPLLERVLAADPSNAELRLALARTQEALGAPTKALAQLEPIRPDDPRYVEARAEAARLLLAAGRPDRAELTLQPALALFPEAPRLWAGWVDVRQARGRGRQTLEALQADPRPKPPEVVLAQSRVLVELGRAEEAIALLSALGTDAAFQAWAELELARGRPEPALEILKRGERRWPGAFGLKAALAQRLAERSETLLEAERLAKEALALAPGSPEVLAALGVVALKRGEGERAARYWGRARRLAPRDPRIQGLADGPGRGTTGAIH